VVERYQFLGYLPRGEQARVALWRELARWPHAAVAFESPRRLPRSLASLARVLPERPLAVCRELTKAFEEVARGTAADVAARFAQAPKGEITLVLGPAPVQAGDEGEARAAVAELVAAGASRRRAAEIVGRLVGVPPNRLYRASL
jgi:16S rRNA (cytidine1402-2'-O)-methyltransferase